MFGPREGFKRCFVQRRAPFGSDLINPSRGAASLSGTKLTLDQFGFFQLLEQIVYRGKTDFGPFAHTACFNRLFDLIAMTGNFGDQAEDG